MQRPEEVLGSLLGGCVGILVKLTYQGVLFAAALKILGVI